MSLNDQQVVQLLQPINATRVLADGKGHAHVSQQDILAHLIRVFGFGNFDTEVLAVECIFEQPAAKNKDRFDVCYRALVRLTIRDPEGQKLASYENGSTATAQNQTRGDAHDLAYKSAISLSIKRAAIALGDQFGLSLYNKGQRDALVRGTLVSPAVPNGQATPDIQEGVPQQVTLGHDEIDTPLDADATTGEERTYQRESPPEPDDTPPPHKATAVGLRTGEQSKRMFAQFTELGIKDRDEYSAYIEGALGHPVESSKLLTRTECGQVLDVQQADINARKLVDQELGIEASE